MRVIYSFMAIIVVTVFAPKASTAQWLPHHAQLSYAPLVAFEVPISGSKVHFPNNVKNDMFWAGMKGGGKGILISIATGFLIAQVTDDWEVGPLYGIYAVPIAIPFGVANGIHKSQRTKPYSSEYSCSVGGAYLGFAGGFLISPFTMGISLVAGPAYVAQRSYQRCAYYKEADIENP
jgi:hypothetical protein